MSQRLSSGHTQECENYRLAYLADRPGGEPRCICGMDESLPRCAVVRGDGSIPSGQCVLGVGHGGPHFGH